LLFKLERKEVKKVEEKEGTRVIVIYADGETKRGTVYSLPSPSDNGFWFNPVNPVNPDGKESQRRFVPLHAIKELVVEK